MRPMVQAATGLILDPYFSASKYAWLLDAVPGARERAAKGEVKLGTIDAWLIWKLTGGKSHVTDATNASRTSLMDLSTRNGGRTSATLFDVPMAGPARDPRLRRSSGRLRRQPVRARPCRSTARRATSRRRWSGHGALKAGDAKITYGTGAFLVANVGRDAGGLDRGCWGRSDTRLTARSPMRWRARSSRPGRRSSGCATG